MSLRVIIVDDEFPAREELKCILEEMGDIEIIGQCEDGDEALPLIKRLAPEVVFLDIQMRLKDGLVTAGEILELSYPPSIVFSTGFSQYATRAFELNAVDYILKPYSIERVNKTVDRLRQLHQVRGQADPLPPILPSDACLASQNLCVWSGDRILVIQPSEIFFAETATNRQTQLHTEKGVLFTKTPLKDLEEMLKQHRFLRTHKSYLVNLNKVTEVIPWFNSTYVLALANCEEKNIPVARYFVKEFNQVMGIS